MKKNNLEKDRKKIHVVGVKIDTKSPHTSEKVYYYKTEKDLKVGQNINIHVPSGGNPVATVVDSNAKRTGKSLKTLKIKN